MINGGLRTVRQCSGRKLVSGRKLANEDKRLFILAIQQRFLEDLGKKLFQNFLRQDFMRFRAILETMPHLVRKKSLYCIVSVLVFVSATAVFRRSSDEDPSAPASHDTKTIMSPSSSLLSARTAASAPARHDRFHPDDPRLVEHLDTHGYVVVASVLGSPDIKTAEGLLWDFLEVRLAGWKRDDERTWYDAEDGRAAEAEGRDERCFASAADRGAENGILHRGGVGQSAVSWFVRARTRGIFERVWAEREVAGRGEGGQGTEQVPAQEDCDAPRPHDAHDARSCVPTPHDDRDADADFCASAPHDDRASAADASTESPAKRCRKAPENSGGQFVPMITSFDGLCVFRPWQRGVGPRTISRPWFHTDQGEGLRGKKSIQGLVTLYPQTAATTGGLTVIPGSHKFHDAILLLPTEERIEFPDENPNYVEVANIENVKKQLGLAEAIVVEADAGDLVLWDSRTLHCNTAAQAESEPQSGTDAARAPPRDRLLRAAIYVCMVPRAFADERCLAARRQAFLRGATSSHWPYGSGLCFQSEGGLVEDVGLWERAGDAVRELV